MCLRLAALLLAALLLLPVAPAEPQAMIPPPDIPTVICLFVDPGPPPHYALRDCDKALVGIVVNGTAGAAWVRAQPCPSVTTDPDVSVGECGPLTP